MTTNALQVVSSCIAFHVSAGLQFISRESVPPASNLIAEANL
jgi:hypothetical protein